MYKKRNEEYDSEPVVYCSKCYSLKIKHEDLIDADYCMECGCSDVLTSSIEEWERLYENRYGSPYVKRNNDPKTTYIFKLSLNELKEKVYNSPEWDEIIKALYPRFPKGLGKADSVILLFDRLIRDNRLNDLKMLLLEWKY